MNKIIKSLHDKAMDEADLALYQRRIGNEQQAIVHFENAFKLEQEAALTLTGNIEAEPDRSILLRSAASLALDTKNIAQAEKLICIALSGNPPLVIAEELRDLLEQVHFQRHLDLRGITLHNNEMQMSLAGKAVNFGLAPSNAFIDRVTKTETLLWRTAERKDRLPFKEKGHNSARMREELGCYLSVPRAASFAVTFKVGTSDQLGLEGFSKNEEVIDEFIDCLNLFTTGSEEKLKQRISDEAYYRNFIALARGIAPDGEDINLVGFTTQRKTGEARVALTSKDRFDRFEIASSAYKQIEVKQNDGRVIITGILNFADSRKEGKEKIKIIDADEVAHSITVPEGMMSDIVKPLWETKVIATVDRKGKTLKLIHIEAANS